MKKLTIFVLLLGSFLGYAQHTKKKVYKKPIKKTYRKPKAPTNPINATITTEGVPVEKVKQTEQAVSVAQETPKAEFISVEKPEFEATAEKIAKQKGWINNRNSALTRGVEAFIKGVYSGDGKIYFLLKVDNRSNIPYEVKNITFVASPKDQKMSKEEENRDEKNFMPIWSNTPKEFREKSTQKLVFVFDKFTINDGKILNIILREKNGERALNIPVNSKFILNAKYIN
ncbi:DUF4138 domain-containing protein [Chryseobacterium potabilaquae]|uniref:DUF4138 domain-containing protein n=1 Tax=Chryseobacterium potabilaquae TaxID=2675057 RepID=A0A6N4X8M8_9FLAO|nr:DUF4138 domain-containing protein [Chryseobacterium potabilaquae]CAA7197456.1 hypothetical protein CHRY9293_03515 [Chryseobacterium potabilaquae]